MPPRKKAATGPTPVEDLRHDDTRANIPTGELAGFVADEQGVPPVRYARDPSLDPQLVWRGKDEQDSADLEVPSVPIYVQEKVVPRAIVEDLRRSPVEDDVPSLFDDCDGLDFGDKVDFYAHEANWSNRMILGDSLLAMTSLAEREGLRGKVQMIYLDPPYGIRFGSNWQVSTRKRDVKDGKAEDATRQPEQVKAFRDTWELGIHSYPSYLRDRLTVARDLLTESGSIFVQISDANVPRVRCVMDEVFGDAQQVANDRVEKGVARYEYHSELIQLSPLVQPRHRSCPREEALPNPRSAGRLHGRPGQVGAPRATLGRYRACHDAR
jgi:adenine-specific DNA-methyltransferase